MPGLDDTGSLGKNTVWDDSYLQEHQGGRYRQNECLAVNNRHLLKIIVREIKYVIIKFYQYKIMSNIEQFLRQYPQETQRVLGINAEQLKTLTQIAKEKNQEKKKQKPRLIKAGGGREAKLRLEEQIILTLFYLHNLPTFQILGIEFGVSESTAHKIFHEWIKILEELLPPSLMEQLKKKEKKSG